MHSPPSLSIKLNLRNCAKDALTVSNSRHYPNAFPPIPSRHYYLSVFDRLNFLALNLAMRMSVRRRTVIACWPGGMENLHNILCLGSTYFIDFCLKMFAIVGMLLTAVTILKYPQGCP